MYSGIYPLFQKGHEKITNWGETSYWKILTCQKHKEMKYKVNYKFSTWAYKDNEQKVISVRSVQITFSPKQSETDSCLVDTLFTR